jgi:microcystin-dependent protein
VSDPFLGEIKVCSFAFAPRGWAFCNGQLLPINQNQALYSLLGTTYGGDGRTTFALPDLRGRTPLHTGDGLTLGEKAGEQTVTLSVAQTPVHTHLVTASSNPADQDLPAGNVPAVTGENLYSSTASTLMAATAVTSVGGNQAHDNMSPYLVLNFIIALTGIFPSRN